MTLKRFLRGTYNLRSTVKKHISTWDVSIVLTFIKNMPCNSPMAISKKLAMLFMILSGSRVNSILNLKITNLYLTNEECSFTFDTVLKHSRENFNVDPIVFRAYPHDQKLCPVYHTKIYLNYRLSLSSNLGFFITTTKPYREASGATIARWIKETLMEAGIDTGKYTAHSVRGATTSAASLCGIDLQTIKKAAGWSTKGTFYYYYKKEIEFNTQNFGYSLLEKTRVI